MAPKRGSASCRRADSDTKPAAVAITGGFTLLELLVVLAVLAGLLAVALPRFPTLYARVRASYERTDVERQLLALPQLVRQQGRGGVLLDPTAVDAKPPGGPSEAELEEWEPLHVDLPAGWTMRVPKPVFYRFTGACDGGEVELSLPPMRYRYTLPAPLCRPQLAEETSR